jgi:hypothetical protein
VAEVRSRSRRPSVALWPVIGRFLSRDPQARAATVPSGASNPLQQLLMRHISEGYYRLPE